MKFENTDVFNFQGAFRGLRNPLESWNKSDSQFGLVDANYDDGKMDSVAQAWVRQSCIEAEQYSREWCEALDEYWKWLYDQGAILEQKDDMNIIAAIGPKDLDLAHRMIKAGSSDRKFLRQIFVSVDITAPIYFFKEFDAYKVATTANSTSTMYKLTSKPITLDCFETDDMKSDLVYYSIPKFAGGPAENDIGMLSDFMIEQLEFLRQKYLETKDKRYWKELVRWLPCGWLQTRTWTANYETIRAMCKQRRNHKLTEWSESFIKWARNLPYAQYLIFDDENIPFQIEK